MPSPIALVHSDYVALNDNDSSMLDARMMTDRNRLSGCMNAAEINERFTSRVESVASRVIYGLKAKALNDRPTAARLLSKVAKTGDASAMREMGLIKQDMGSFDSAMTWFKRAQRAGSLNAVFDIAELHYRLREYEHTIASYVGHFGEIDGSTAAFGIAKALFMLGRKQASVDWFKMCVKNGCHSGISEIIGRRKKNEDLAELFLKWMDPTNVAGYGKPRGRLPVDMSAYGILETRMPTLASAVRGLPDIGISLPKPQTHFNYEKYTSSGFSGKGNGNDRTLPFFPSRSWTAHFVMVLESVSEQWEKRDLHICYSMIKKVRCVFPAFPFNLQLWRMKCMSKDPKELVKCGFVAALLDDYKVAQQLFDKASRMGQLMGTFMCGIIWFYGLAGERDLETGTLYFAKCQTMEIALMHVGVVTKQKAWRDRAKALMGKCTNPYEVIGDFFADGAKIPKNMTAAIAWYYRQLESYEKGGLSTEAIIDKITRCAHRQTVKA